VSRFGSEMNSSLSFDLDLLDFGPDRVSSHFVYTILMYTTVWTSTIPLLGISRASSTTIRLWLCPGGSFNPHGFNFVFVSLDMASALPRLTQYGTGLDGIDWSSIDERSRALLEDLSIV